MLKGLIKYVRWIAILSIIFISYESVCCIRYENNIFKVTLTSRSDSIMHIDIITKDSERAFSYDAELVKICDEVPERSLSLDVGKLESEVYYLADSTYIVYTDSLYLGFAKEHENNYRLDFDIFESTYPDLPPGIYTLYRIDENGIRYPHSESYDFLRIPISHEKR